MSQAESTAIDHLRHALIDAARSSEVQTARAASQAALSRAKMQGADYNEECNAADLAYWQSLAAATYAQLSEGVRHLVGRKLVPGLRAVNAELRRAVGKHVVLWVEGENSIGKITLEAAMPPTCTNCGADYPDECSACPQCGVA